MAEKRKRIGFVFWPLFLRALILVDIHSCDVMIEVKAKGAVVVGAMAEEAALRAVQERGRGVQTYNPLQGHSPVTQRQKASLTSQLTV